MARNNGPRDDDVVGRQVAHVFDHTARGVVVAANLARSGVVTVDFQGGPKGHPCILDELVPLDSRPQTVQDEFSDPDES